MQAAEPLYTALEQRNEVCYPQGIALPRLCGCVVAGELHDLAL